ncbi:MAG: TrmH family RNA methyltransferase [Candidatus Krumholzibacteriia bacterium]
MTEGRSPSPDPAPTTPERASRPDPDNVVVVLSHTTEPANIGSTCRAMKTMGLKRLRLIAPLNPRGRSARALAHGAQDVLDAAELHDTLDTAVADAVVVVGTTARRRQLRKHALLTPGEAAARVAEHSRDGTVVILFGTERTGLSNDEADICRYLSRVDTSEDQPSLNLAMAVMLYAWEVRQAFLRTEAGLPPPTRRSPASGGDPRRPPHPEMAVRHPHRGTRLPTQFELDSMYAHLAYAMEGLGYSEWERRKFLTYLRHLHMRAGMVDWEMQIYHLLARRIVELTGLPAFNGQ